MWERLRRFSALERPAQELFLRAVVLLPLVALSLRWRGFRETQAALERFLSKANPGPDAALASKVAAVTGVMFVTNTEALKEAEEFVPMVGSPALFCS